MSSPRVSVRQLNSRLHQSTWAHNEHSLQAIKRSHRLEWLHLEQPGRPRLAVWWEAIAREPIAE